MTEINVTPASTPEDAAHVAAMAAKAENVQIETPDPVGDDPTAGAQLTPETPKQPEQKPEAGTEEKPEATPESAQNVVEQAGLDMASLEDKYAANGSLDDSDYAALEAAGVNREMVDMYIAGQEALGQQMTDRMAQSVGGEQTLNDMLQWAGQNLTPEQVNAFNSTIDTGDEAAVTLALKGLQMQFNSAGQNQPSLLGGQTTTPTVDVFRSTAELTKAMSDPRYAADKAYREDVIAKLNRSSIF